MIVFHIAIRNGVRSICLPYLEKYYSFYEEDKRKLNISKYEKIIDKADERIKRLEFNLSDIQSSKAIGIYITTVCEEFIKELTNTDVLKEQRTHIKDYLNRNCYA